MNLLTRIARRASGAYLAPRAALAAALPAVVLVFLSGWWAYGATAVWFVVWLWLVRSEYRGAVGPHDVTITRTVPVKFSIGVANPVTLHVVNRSSRVARIAGRETPPAGFAGERAISPFEIEPHGEAEIAFEFTPPARGAYSFGNVGIRTLGPLGVAGRRFDAPGTRDVRVYPDITAVTGYSLLARKGALHEIGVRAARFSGLGTEYESLRDYEPGDDYRDIDWKATARRGAPVVRRFEAERSQTVMLAIDAGRLMTPRVGALTKLDRSVNAALLLAWLASQAGDNVGLLVFARDVQVFLPPRKGHKQFLRILEALYAVEGRIEEPDYAGALRFLATRVTKRSLVVLFTELVGTEPSRRLLGVLGGIAPRHLPLVVTQRNAQIERVATAVPETESEVFRATVAQDLLHDKAGALRLLAARGSLVLDVEPEALSVAAVNRYLEIKARGRL
ncbi:MAG: DUF58 domain-containing protein [Coriobacteriia bacterium]